MKRLIFCLALASSLNAFADSPYRKAPGTPICDDVKQSCEYQTVNATPTVVIQSVNNTILEGRGSCGTSGVYICKGDGPNTIFFAHKDKKIYEELKTRIPVLDRLPKMSDVPLVEVGVDVYAVTEEAYSRINIELSDVGNGFKEKSQEKMFKTSDDGGGVKLGLNFGSAKFNALIAAERGQGRVDFITSVVRYVPNGQDISYENRREIVKAIGVGDKQTITSGLRMDGKVNIADGDDPLVFIENYSLSYGVPDPANRSEITSLAISETTLPLKPGVAIGLSSETKATVVRGRAMGFFKLRRAKEDSQAQLLVVMRVRPITFQQFISESVEQLGDVDPNPKMNPTEVGDLETCSSLESVLANVQPFARALRGGNYVLGFKLGACASNESFYNQHVDIEVKASGYNDKGFRSLNNLMAGEYRFAPIPRKMLSESRVEFKVILKERRTQKKVESKLVFTPETTEIYKD
jgi:hypothetical protein